MGGHANDWGKGGDFVLSFEADENQVEKIEGMTVEYPYCLHLRNLTDIVIPWHWHPELELGYIAEGASRIRTVNAEYVVRQGEGFFINSNVMDMKENAVPGTSTLEVNHIFHPVFLGGHFKSRFETKYLDPLVRNRRIEVRLIRPGHRTTDRLLANLRTLKELQEHPDTEFATRNLLSESWMLLLKNIEEAPPAESAAGVESQDCLRGMIAYMHSHYSEKLTLAQIASRAAVSEREALRCFRKHLRQTPFEYLTAFRLNQAKRLLAETDLSVTQISYQCGFSDSAYMGKVFKREFGLTPLAYRKTRESAIDKSVEEGKHNGA